jgi:UDP-glucose 4-epimerase
MARKRKVLFLGTNALLGDAADALAVSGEYGEIATAGSGPEAVRSGHRKLNFLSRNAAANLAGILSEFCPDVVVDLTRSESPVTPNQAWKTDRGATQSILSALARWRARNPKSRLRVVALSATAVYGITRTSPLIYTEADAAEGAGVEASSAFGRWVRGLCDKEAAYREFATRERVGLMVLRAAPIVGGPVSSVLADAFDRPVAARAAGFDPPVQVVHYSDFVAAVERVAGDDFEGALNVVGRGVMRLSRVAAALGCLAVPVPGAVTGRFGAGALGSGALSGRSIADGRLARQVLGFMPRYSAEEALVA